MWRNLVIAAAGLLGAAVLVAGLNQMSPAPTEVAAADAGEVADVVADAAQQMRLCVGPARVTLGGEPFVGLAFGGDGCSKNADLVGFRILRKPSLLDSPTLTSLLSF